MAFEPIQVKARQRRSPKRTRVLSRIRLRRCRTSRLLKNTRIVSTHKVDWLSTAGHGPRWFLREVVVRTLRLGFESADINH